jgi:predicted MFS family arabinose efflux permease
VGIYQYQANITMIISLGIVVGSILGGRLADLRTRKFSVYSSLIITTIALLLLLIPTYVVILLFFGSIIGLALGWRHSAYAAVVSQMAKHHPDVDSTYLSVANSFTNLGSVIGLALVGVILDLFLSFEVLIVFMALISNLTAIPFAFMDPTYYEHKLLKKSITLEKE